MPCGGVSEGKLVLFSLHPRLSFSSFSGIVSAFSGGHNISLQMSCLQYLSTVFASHPLNGWIWFGEGLRSYDNWQRCAASDFNQNEHGETAIPLKTVAATTPKSRAEEKLLRLI